MKYDELSLIYDDYLQQLKRKYNSGKMSARQFYKLAGKLTAWDELAYERLGDE
jgi:arginyl-tRNA--protein-N-Asp/Glu arginylyltransferase